MEPKEPKFRFEIGDLVVLKTGIEECRLGAGFGVIHPPNVLMILERMAQECPGGVQLHYLVSRTGEEKFMVMEIMLLPVSAYDQEVFRSQARAAKWADRAADRAHYKDQD